MNKIIAIAFLLIYSMTHAGLAIKEHYCGEKITSVQFAGSTEKKCACHQQKALNDCCKEKHKPVKIEDKYNFNQLLLSFFKNFVQIADSLIFKAHHFVMASSAIFIEIAEHLNSLKIPLHLFLRVLLI